MLVIVGSTSEHKIEAVKIAFFRHNQKADIVGCKTQSGVNEQPVGLEETLMGAKNRAADAFQQQNAGSIFIGIESGILRAGGITIDIGVVYMLHQNGMIRVGTSPGIQFPEHFVCEAERRGFDKTTVGSVIAEKLGCNSADPHSHLTKHRISRSETLIEGIRAALTNSYR